MKTMFPRIDAVLTMLVIMVLAVSTLAQEPLVTIHGRKASAAGLLVKVKDGRNAAKVLSAKSQLGKMAMKTKAEFRTKGLMLVGKDVKGRVSVAMTNAELEQKAKELMATGLYEYVEPDWVVTVNQVPTDSAYTDGSLWGLRNTGQNGGVAGVDVNAQPAWALTTGSPAVIVGVVDTGIRYTHQDIAGNMWVNPGEIAGNGLDDDANGYIDDIHGINGITGTGDPMDDNNHGTHCAGTIGATANDAGQIVGVAWNVKLMGLKFLSASGSGNTSDAIKCIDYGVAKGAHILSNSWGGGGYSQALRDSIAAASAAGVLFVAAAGNSSSNNDTTENYPSNYDPVNVVAVAAVDRTGALASFSSYGATTVDVGAPGVSILSSTATSDSSYASFNGTSMATPHVSGVAALIKSQFPAATMLEIKNRLMATTRPLASLTGKTVSGGIVDAHAALTVSADGVLEMRAAAAANPLTNGVSTAFYVTVTDLTPVTGATVTGALDAAPATAFLDNGVAPDVTANDGIYSASLTVPATGSSTTLNVTASNGGPPANGAFVFSISSPPVNDAFASRLVLAAGTTQTTGTNRLATFEVGEPRFPSVAGSKSVWWEWVAGTSGSITVTTSGSSYDTTLAVYSGSGTLASLVHLASNDDSIGLASSVNFTAVSGQSYYLQVNGYGASEGSITLNYPAPASVDSPPVIVTQPAGAILVAGDPLSLSVTASGTAPLSYQWALDNSPIPTATTSTYTVGSVTSADQGNYTVTITNAFGSITSAAAFIGVDPISVRPPNDAFADAEPLAGATGRVSGSNLRASGESGEPNHAAASTPVESVWYRWTAPAGGTLTLDTYGSSLDTTLAVYTGTAVNALTQQAANNDSGGVQSFVSLGVTAGEVLSIAVDGAGTAESLFSLNYLFQPEVAGLANDAFANRAVVSGAGGSFTGSNISATGEAGEPVHEVSAPPTASVWWSWTAPANGVAVIDTLGSDFDTVLAVYEGNQVSTLTRVTSNDDAGGLQSRVAFPCTTGTAYAIAVDGQGTAQGLITLNITSGITEPEIAVEQPAGNGLVDGGTGVSWGNVATGTNTIRTFTVRNTGGASLMGLSVRIEGAHAADFSLSVPPPSAVIPGGSTSFTVQFMPSALGLRSVVLRLTSNDADENPFDIALSGTGLAAPAGMDFKILSLATTGAAVVDHNALTGDDRGGIAVSSSRVFVTGDNATSRHALSDLSGGASIGRVSDGLCSDIGTGSVYVLAHNGLEIFGASSTVSQLIELDPLTGGLTGNVIPLSQSFVTGPPSSNGVFSGNGRVVLYNGTRVYDIMVPSGVVTDLGAMSLPNMLGSENWASWGVAEFFNGSVHLAYRSSASSDMIRCRVPDGQVELIATFSNLSDLASWTVSPITNRWYFHHEYDGQFGGSSETLGYADATFEMGPPTQPPAITSPLTTTAYTGQPFSYSIQATRSPTSYGASGLPAWLSLNPVTGVLSGTPVSPGSHTISISATNAAGTTTESLSITVTTAPVAGNFKILSLGTSGSAVVDHDILTGDDRGGIAVTTSQVFVTGDIATSRHALNDLSGGTSIGRVSNGLCSDLSNGTAYVLAHNGTEIVGSGSMVSQLIQLNPLTGALGTIIPLSTSFVTGTGMNGVFSGHGRVVVHTGSRVFDIMVPSGLVIDRGAMTAPNWYGSESWAIWGVAEFFNGSIHLAYRPFDSSSIVRSRVPDGQMTTISTFTSLGDMASWTVSPVNNRWYFHHESSSQFGGSWETLGYADATFEVGNPTQPPAITSPLTATGYITLPFSYQITASRSPTSYHATGLPAWLGINTTTGVLSGTPISAGTHVISISATNVVGTTTETLTITVADLQAAFSEDFDPDINLALWSGFGGVVTANTAGQAAGAGSTGNSLHFDGTGSRFATTIPLNTTAGGVVSFKIALASGTSQFWENADSGEDVVLEYSHDGSTFFQMGGPYSNRTWQFLIVDIPLDARTPSTRFRWRQLSNSGTGFDHWAIEDVQISSSGTTAPEITLEQPVGTSLVDGVSIVDFGSMPTGTETSLTFTVRNDGTADLGGLSVTFGGTHAADFTLTTAPATTVAPPGTTTFVVRFAPGSIGSRSATLQLASNDSDENPFDLILVGTGVMPEPEIVVEQPAGTALTDGVSISSLPPVLPGSSSESTFTIRNTGSGILSGLAASFTGGQASAFSLVTSPPASLVPGGSGTFTVRFSPAALGNYTTTMQISSNDADENPFDITLTSSSTISQNVLVNFDGASAPTGFVDQTLPISAYAPSSIQFTNTTMKVLDQGSGFGVAGHSAPNFLAWNTWGGTNNGVSFNFPQPVSGFSMKAGGDSAGTATVSAYDSSNVLLYSTSVVISSSLLTTISLPSVQVSRVTFATTGAVGVIDDISYQIPVPAEIAVEQPVGSNLSDGASTIAFGLAATPVSRFFTVRNTGAAPLTGISLTIDGAHSTDFNVLTPPATSVAAGAFTTFAIAFTPSTLGTRTAALHVLSNDADESPFDINLTATAITPAGGLDNWLPPALPDRTPMGIPHADGVPNLLKYAFNLDSNAPDHRTMQPGGTSGLPIIEPQPAGNVFRFEYLRRIGSGLIYTPEKSSSLDSGSWTTLGSTPTVTPVDEAWERVIYQEPVNPVLTPFCFGRVRVQMP